MFTNLVILLRIPFRAQVLVKLSLNFFGRSRKVKILWPKSNI